MLFGIIGSAVGIYVSMLQLVDNVKSNPNPFADLFKFG
jgi:hypothetical protein